ncbi:MAG: hypothetical protein JXA49_06700 [Actinobacteria bacterium]|nr:hypothetical protein [Actinomycetota bacterium]
MVLNNKRILTVSILITALIVLLSCGIAYAGPVVQVSSTRSAMAEDWVKSFETAEKLKSVFTLDDNHVWAVGEQGIILFYDGNLWSRQTSGTTRFLSGVWASDPDNVWAVGQDHIVLHYNGNFWATQYINDDDPGDFHSVSGVDAENIWAVGDYSAIFNCNGSSWSEVDHTLAGTLNGVSAYSTDYVWAAGSNEEAGCFDGNAWTADMFDDGNLSFVSTLRGIQVLGKNNVVTWTENAGPYLYDGTKWRQPSYMPDTRWIDACSPDPDNVYFSTDDGVYHYNGSHFNPIGSPVEFDRIAVSPSGKLWCIDRPGTTIYTLGTVPDEPDDNPDDISDYPIPRPSKTWYFAEGSTNGGFETWIQVQNPGDGPANVSVTYMTGGGPVAGPAAVVPPESRATFNVAETVPETWDVSTMVTSDIEVIAERTMFWLGRAGGHNTIGITKPYEGWGAAEGSTNGGFETWLLIQNPNSHPVTAEIYYVTPEGPWEGPKVPMQPNSRASVNVADYIPDEWDVSTLVFCDYPIVVERSTYWAGRSGGHNSITSAVISKNWYLTEGCTRGGFETWVLVLNPLDHAVEITLDFLTEDGLIQGPEVVLPEFTRQSFSVADYVPNNWNVSTIVGASDTIMAERSIYWAGRTGGNSSIGNVMASKNWHLAEGSTNGGFETWVLVMNPWDEPVEVELSYLTCEGKKNGPKVTLDPLSRFSFHLADGMPNTWEVSATISAEKEVMVEKSIYWGNRADGGSSLGIPRLE